MKKEDIKAFLQELRSRIHDSLSDVEDLADEDAIVDSDETSTAFEGLVESFDGVFESIEALDRELEK